MNEDKKRKIKIVTEIIIIIVTLVLFFLISTDRLKLFKVEKEEEKEVTGIMSDLVSSDLYEQLKIDLDNKEITIDQYVLYNLYAEYDNSKLDDRYYNLEKSEASIDTDDLVAMNKDYLSDNTIKYYLNKVLLEDISFGINANNRKSQNGDVIATSDIADFFIEKVYAEEKYEVTLNKAVVSGNENFILWYTDSGDNAVDESVIKKMAYYLEVARYTYDNLYTKIFSYKPIFQNKGTRYEEQINVLESLDIDPSLLDTAMQVYVVDFTSTSNAKYVNGSSTLISLYDEYYYGMEDGSINAPYLLIKPSSLGNIERATQIVNRELFRYYQYNVYCPGDDCIISNDLYLFDATAAFASALATKKTDNSGYLNDYASIAKAHADDLLSDKLATEIGTRNVANSLFIYLYNYSQVVENGDTKIIDALYTNDSVSKLEKGATKDNLTTILQNIIYYNLTQGYSNFNLIVSSDNVVDVPYAAKVTGDKEFEKVKLNKIGINYYDLKNGQYEIALNRNSEDVTGVLIGVDGTKYKVLAYAPVSSINVKFDTSNYSGYNEYYFVVANIQISQSNYYSLKLTKK